MNRDKAICSKCQHFVSRGGYCAILDGIDVLMAEEIQDEEDRKLFGTMALIAGLPPVSKNKINLKKVDRERLLDAKCPYILEQIVLRE